MLREPTPKLVRYLACTGQAAVLLIPLQATGQQANFEIKADVGVREDSFACKEISELDRLLQINQRGGFISGTQLYDYLQRHSCVGLTAGRARVYANKGQYVCIYDLRTRITRLSLVPGHEETCCRNEHTFRCSSRCR